MATRRAYRVKGAYSEEAERLRRAILEPVYKWERGWANPKLDGREVDVVNKYKILKWRKTSEKSQFDPKEEEMYHVEENMAEDVEEENLDEGFMEISKENHETGQDGDIETKDNEGMGEDEEGEMGDGERVREREIGKIVNVDKGSQPNRERDAITSLTNNHNLKNTIDSDGGIIEEDEDEEEEEDIDEDGYEILGKKETTENTGNNSKTLDASGVYRIADGDYSNDAEVDSKNKDDGEADESGFKSGDVEYDSDDLYNVEIQAKEHRKDNGDSKETWAQLSGQGSKEVEPGYASKSGTANVNEQAKDISTKGKRKSENIFLTNSDSDGMYD